MELNELQSVRDRERQTDKLQQLRESFYADAGEFIQQLRAERDRAVERADDPFDSAEVRQLSDEIKTAEQTVEAIYEKRVGKIVKAASFAAADLPTEVDGMTAEEQTLFDNLVGDIKDNRQQVLDLLDGEDSNSQPTGSNSPTPESASRPDPEQSQPDAVPPDVPPHQEDTDSDADVTAADVMATDESADSSAQADEYPPPDQADSTPPNDSESSASEAVTSSEDSSTESADQPVREDGGKEMVAREGASHSAQANHESAESDKPDVERQRVQILEDVDTFLGFDERDYDLETDDVVSLPATNADILLERGVAREL